MPATSFAAIFRPFSVTTNSRQLQQPFQSFKVHGHDKSIWVRESKSHWSFPGEVARRERPSPVLAMNPVRLLLVLVGAGSSAAAAPSRISPGRLLCFSSIHTVLVTLVLAHGYELLPETSEFSTNAIPNPYTRKKIKDTCLRNLYLRLLLDVSLISMYLSTPREQKGVTFLVCDSTLRAEILFLEQPRLPKR